LVERAELTADDGERRFERGRPAERIGGVHRDAPARLEEDGRWLDVHLRRARSQRRERQAEALARLRTARGELEEQRHAWFLETRGRNQLPLPRAAARDRASQSPELRRAAQLRLIYRRAVRVGGDADHPRPRAPVGRQARRIDDARELIG